MSLTRKSEIIIPEKVDALYQLTCSVTGAHTSLLTGTGAYNVAMTISPACDGEHRMIKVVLS